MISFNSEQAILVTGATSGIGKAVALLLNKLGASVIALGRNYDKLENLKNEACHKENFYTECIDLSCDIEQLPDVIKNLKDKYGKFYGLACCAGVDELAVTNSMTVDMINRVFSVNYIAPMMLIKGFADKRNNIGAGSSIVCISSIAASEAEKGQIVYAGSKGALNSSVKAISKELVQKRIRINIVSPAAVDTPLLYDNPQRSELISRCKLGAIQTYEVANTVVFLLSGLSAKITGAEYFVNGGYSFG